MGHYRNIRRYESMNFNQGRLRESMNEIRFFSILKENLILLRNRLSKYDIVSKIYGPWKNSLGGEYYCLKIKQDDFMKLKGGDENKPKK